MRLLRHKLTILALSAKRRSGGSSLQAGRALAEAAVLSAQPETRATEKAAERVRLNCHERRCREERHIGGIPVNNAPHPS
jgi:hypothetical protein